MRLWYRIYTSIDHSDGDGEAKFEFAEKLKVACQRVCFMSECEGDPYSETYCDILRCTSLLPPLVNIFL